MCPNLDLGNKLPLINTRRCAATPPQSATLTAPPQGEACFICDEVDKAKSLSPSRARTVNS